MRGGAQREHGLQPVLELQRGEEEEQDGVQEQRLCPLTPPLHEAQNQNVCLNIQTYSDTNLD